MGDFASAPAELAKDFTNSDMFAEHKSSYF